MTRTLKELSDEIDKRSSTDRLPVREPEDQRWLLRMSLSVSVPLWMHEYRCLDKSTLEFIARKNGAVLGEKGAALLFRVKRNGQSASVFNDLSRGLAAACLATGQTAEEVLDKLWP